MQKAAGRITELLASRWFYRGVMLFFVMEALWIALSALYPMAFDEEFHLGVIKLYAGNWGPFLPADAGSGGQFGAVARDPSYLFHWLMSFPYRLVTVFTDSQTAAVIFLRLINIGLFVTGLMLFYRLLKNVGTSRAFSHAALLLFVLIPVVPLLAGQINYDNLLMIFAAWACLLVVSLHRSLTKRRIDLRAIGLLLLACIFGSLVKYAFLPIAVAAVLYVAAVGLWSFRRHWSRVGRELNKAYTGLGSLTKLSLAALLIVGAAFGFQRYGLNVLNYGAPIPDCAAVLSVNQCQNYGPWQRNRLLSLDKARADTSPVKYTKEEWLKGMHKRLFFMINGPHHHSYQNYPPSPFPANTATAIFYAGIIAVPLFAWRIFRLRPALLALVFLPLLYIVAVWTNNYFEYREIGQAVAVNGRYLIPVLLPLTAVAGAGLHYALRRVPSVKPFLATTAILLFLQAGGVFSFILRSDDTWYWQNDIVVYINHAAKGVFEPLMHQGAGRD